jgi:predicted dehydrogenase/threonine dehydrogenase-like Zn-dependent dehydrogenase
LEQVLIRKGEAAVEEVPAPTVSTGSILVAVEYSCISVGTEMASLNMSALPLYRRALQQPENVRRVMTLVRNEGLVRTMRRVRGQLAAGSPSGYSAAGRVIEVGTNVTGFQPGDSVACAGAGIANHAEIIDVPVNLAVRIPEGADMRSASTVTLGAIALQGVRRANPTLGEIFVVVGLGILGQITAQLLRASGCRVIGVDPIAPRRALALTLGAEHAIDPLAGNYPDQVQQLTDGFGADGVIITAAGGSDEIVSLAFQACRKRGRVVLVGDVGLSIRRSDIYTKEIDFFISCSYGPGRYDSLYEETGLDYPVGFVRWTENRNMQAYLDMVATHRIDVGALVATVYPVEKAGEAFASLNSPDKPMGILLQYVPKTEVPVHTLLLRKAEPVGSEIRIGVIGAGSFVQAVHLANMVRLRRRYRLRGVASKIGSDAKAVAKTYEADYASTDPEEVLKDPNVDLVLIGTRHDLHGSLVLRALEAGKHVFVEKPLAVNEDQLSAIEAYYKVERSQVLFTGFNRRFSPALTAAKTFLVGRGSPLIVTYQMNAGYISLASWVHTEEGAGRNIGEGCHIYDLFSFLTGATVEKVTAAAIRPGSRHWARNDNFVATVSYSDGSVCTLAYTALGTGTYPKERMQIFAAGTVAVMDDYKSIVVYGRNAPGWSSKQADKGHLRELTVLADCLQKGGDWPISLAEQVAATRVSFEVERQIISGEARP